MIASLFLVEPAESFATELQTDTTSAPTRCRAAVHVPVAVGPTTSSGPVPTAAVAATASAS